MIEALATPTRFLIESGEWNLTPNLSGSIQHEIDPFDCNFQQQQKPAAKIVDNIPQTEPNWSPTISHITFNDPNKPNVMRTSASLTPEIETVTSPPTPSMSLSQSPSSSSSTFMLSPDNITSPIQTNNTIMNQYAAEDKTRRSSRIQTKQQYSSSEYTSRYNEQSASPPPNFNQRTSSVQSGRKRRIVFEGDDAEDRRKKFLERNRVAAYKCRQKKKNWMQDLEQKADIQNSHNEELRTMVSQLKEESMYLRNLLLTHGNCDCESVQAYLRKTSAEITSNAAPSLAMSSRRTSIASTSTFAPLQTYSSSFSSNLPSFSETSTGLTPFLNTVINKSNTEPNDYFSHAHNIES